MTRMPTDIATYMDTAMRAIAMIDERQALIDWWTDQKPYLDHLGIKSGSVDGKRLRQAWEARGKAIVVSSPSTTIDRTRAA